MSTISNDVLTNEEASIVWVPIAAAMDEPGALAVALDHLRATGYMDDADEGWESDYSAAGRKWLRDTAPKDANPVVFYDYSWRVCEPTDEGAVEFWEVSA